MAKLLMTVKYIDDDGVIQEWDAVYDLDTSRGNSNELAERMRKLMRRELIRRSLLVSSPEDKTK